MDYERVLERLASCTELQRLSQLAVIFDTLKTTVDKLRQSRSRPICKHKHATGAPITSLSGLGNACTSKRPAFRSSKSLRSSECMRRHGSNG